MPNRPRGQCYESISQNRETGIIFLMCFYKFCELTIYKFLHVHLQVLQCAFTSSYMCIYKFFSVHLQVLTCAFTSSSVCIYKFLHVHLQVLQCAFTYKFLNVHLQVLQCAFTSSSMYIYKFFHVHLQFTSSFTCIYNLQVLSRAFTFLKCVFKKVFLRKSNRSRIVSTQFST
jgi:hypothetical protein